MRHNVLDFRPVLLDEVASKTDRTRKDFQQSGTLMTGADFAAAEEVSLGDHPNEPILLIHHRESADTAAQHYCRRIDH